MAEGKAGARAVDVVICGAGPVGLVLANYLGTYGISTLVLEKLDALIDYPRAIGLDDEALRTMQGVGLADAIARHITPHHWMRFLTARGRCWASVEPRTDEFGWSRRNAFIQPQADAILGEGLKRFPHVEMLFGAELESFAQDGEGVSIIAATKDGPVPVRARYMVGTDGGRSKVREGLGLTFDGKTAPNQWIVVDVADDPVGTPNIFLVCDPLRPYVSAALPHGIRRFEFMVMPGETEEHLTKPEVMRTLLAKVVEKPEAVRIIRQRQYAHNARLASRFRVGRVLLAGDSAHIMPVWQGQGYNSGVRDAANLGWKLAWVVKGLAGEGLLDTYEEERREHAKAMIDLSVTAGKIFNPPARWLGTLRDGLTLVLNRIPSVKRYILEMRFKPMPRFASGSIWRPGTRPANDPVGRLFPQPQVIAQGQRMRFDDVIGPEFAVIGWGNDPAAYMDEASLELWGKLGARFVKVVPACQLGTGGAPREGLIEVGDADNRFKDWFGAQSHGVVFLRPDRIVAATSSPQRVNEASMALAQALRTKA